MPERFITPLSQIDRQVPEAGRIRLGYKKKIAGQDKNGNDKFRQESLDHFRFTSQYKHLLDQLAAIYGGEVTPWHDDKASPKDQFQLYSQANRIKVMLVPNTCSIWYELWSGKGCARRCDGETCKVPRQTGPHDMEIVDVECLCEQEGKLTCKKKTRIQFVFPDVSFAGAWRLESGGDAASKELPGMVELIEAVTVRGRMVEAVLSIDRREHMTEVGKRNFVVPKLELANTPMELATGASTLAIEGQSVQPPSLQLGAAPLTPNLDDDIAEAEILTDEQLDIEDRLRADGMQFGLDPRAYVDAVRAEAEYRASQAPDGPGTWERMARCSELVRAGQLEPTALSRGKVRWQGLTKVQ